MKKSSQCADACEFEIVEQGSSLAIYHVDKSGERQNYTDAVLMAAFNFLSRCKEDGALFEPTKPDGKCYWMGLSEVEICHDSPTLSVIDGGKKDV